MSDPTSKNRSLPIVGQRPQTPPNQGPSDGEDDHDRPPWHGSGMGVVATFLVWLPSASLLNAWVARSLRSVDPKDSVDLAAVAPVHVRAVMISTNVACFALAAFVGGYLVGRFGGRAKLREAGMGGLVATAIAWLLALTQTPNPNFVVWALLLLLMALLGGGAATIGGRAGLRRRPPPA